MEKINITVANSNEHIADAFVLGTLQPNETNVVMSQDNLLMLLNNMPTSDIKTAIYNEIAKIKEDASGLSLSHDKTRAMIIKFAQKIINRNEFLVDVEKIWEDSKLI